MSCSIDWPTDRLPDWHRLNDKIFCPPLTKRIALDVVVVDVESFRRPRDAISPFQTDLTHLSLSLSSCLCHDIDLFVSNCLCIKLFLLSFPVYLSHYVNSFDLCLSFCVCVFLFEPVILSIPSFALFFLSLLVLSYLLLPPSNPTGRPIYFVCFSPIFFLCLSNISSHYLDECLSYQSFCFDLWSLCFHFRTYESKQWMCFFISFQVCLLTFNVSTFDVWQFFICPNSFGESSRSHFTISVFTYSIVFFCT